MTQQIAKSVTDWVGSVVGVPTAYGEMPPVKGPRAMVKASPVEPLVRGYASGGGVYRFAYEVYLMVSASAEEKRLDGMATLGRLFEAVEARLVPDDGREYTSHEVTNLPSLYAEGPGTETVYQLTAQLTYLVRG